MKKAELTEVEAVSIMFAGVGSLYAMVFLLSWSYPLEERMQLASTGAFIAFCVLFFVIHWHCRVKPHEMDLTKLNTALKKKKRHLWQDTDAISYEKKPKRSWRLEDELVDKDTKIDLLPTTDAEKADVDVRLRRAFKKMKGEP